MAEITSAMAAKYLRKLNEEHDALLQKEKKSDTFTASVQEKDRGCSPGIRLCYGAAPAPGTGR